MENEWYWQKEKKKKNSWEEKEKEGSSGYRHCDLRESLNPNMKLYHKRANVIY